MSDEQSTFDALIQAVARIPATQIPTAIGRYKVVRKLGAGGMGVVYEAEDPELARDVAIKVLHERADDTRANHLKREAQTLARLTHPNVISVYDVGTHDGELYIVMQLVDGVTLDQHLATRSPTEIVGDFVEAGRGLVAAHAEGIVHRDFKPSNVLVGKNHTIRVSDFGIAHGGMRVGDPNAAVELTTASPVGTPAYMAPEQLAGGEVTAAADQFAFCVALWEALQGERPFAGTTLAELAAAIDGRELREPKRRMSRRVRAALIRGLSPRAADRFPSMTALLAELTPRRKTEAYVVGGAVVAMSALLLITQRGGSDCDKAAARDWTATLAAARQRGGEDARAVTELVERWPKLRNAACVGGRAAERQAACLDTAVGKLERALATPLWISERWGPVRADLPALDRCTAGDPPTVTTIGSRRGSSDARTKLVLGEDGRIAIATGRSIEVLLATGALDTSVASPHLDPEDLDRWTSEGLIFKHPASVEIIDPKTGATLNNHSIPPHTIAISHDGKRALTETTGRWELLSLSERAPKPLTAGEASGGSAEWSADDRQIAAIATFRRGPQVGSWLRIIDARTGIAVDTAIQLDHGIVDGIDLAWLDATHVVLNGRAAADTGEGLWIARIADDGRVAGWEQRLPASTGTGYRIRGIHGGRALAELQTANDKLIRINNEAPAIISQMIAPVPRGGLELSVDGSRALITSGRGRGWVRLDTGAFTPVAISGTGRVAIDREDRVLSIIRSDAAEAGETLIAATSHGNQRLVDVPLGSQVRCDPTGVTCLTFTVVDRKTVVRVLGGSTITLEVDALDLAVAPDGEHVAITGHQDTILLGDLRTGELEHRSTDTVTCGAARFTELVAWSKDALYVSARCGEGKSRIVRLVPGAEPVQIYDGPWIGNLAVISDDEIVAIRRTIEAQPIVIEGL